ncbi:MAG: SLBB domain-containing protein, partial [Candidatus Omnitrophota bacterium]
TLNEARVTVGRAIDQKYSNVRFDLNVSDVRDIRVNVLGNVKNPGVYAVSPFTRIADALVLAGGPNKEGSVSDIRLTRDDKVISSLDIYSYIFKGDQSKNLRLRHGDLIYVPQTGHLVAVRGGVRYPGIYEAKEGMKLSEVIEVAGGMIDTKFDRKLTVLRINTDNKLTEVFKEVSFSQKDGIPKRDDIIIEDEDTVIVTTTLDYTPYPQDLFNVVHISGEVKIPGDYLIKKDDTLRSILNRAGGLSESAFPAGTVFKRQSLISKEKEIVKVLIDRYKHSILDEEIKLSELPLTEDERQKKQLAIQRKREILDIMLAREIDGRIIINLKDILDSKSDISLIKGDSLFIPKKMDWVMVTGATFCTRSIAFVAGKPLQYYLDLVGGLTEYADNEQIYVVRANGSVVSKNTGYGEISPGDIIVVPEKI